jgi:hypothetical protein
MKVYTLSVTLISKMSSNHADEKTQQPVDLSTNAELCKQMEALWKRLSGFSVHLRFAFYKRINVSGVKPGIYPGMQIAALSDPDGPCVIIVGTGIDTRSSAFDLRYFVDRCDDKVFEDEVERLCNECFVTYYTSLEARRDLVLALEVAFAAMARRKASTNQQVAVTVPAAAPR